MRKLHAWLVPLVLLIGVVAFSVMDVLPGQGGPTIVPPAESIHTADARESVRRLRSDWATVLRQAGQLPPDERKEYIDQQVEAKAKLFALALTTRLSRVAEGHDTLGAQVLEELAEGVEPAKRGRTDTL